MGKKILAFVFAAAMLVAMAVPLFGGGTASAQVHAISQAPCGQSSNAGATHSSDSTPGGPSIGPIPVVASTTGNTASNGKSIQKFGGGNLEGSGGDCDAPGDVRQN